VYQITAIERLSDRIIGAALNGRNYLWTRCKPRKAAHCAVTGQPISGYAYRPLTNSNDRMLRIAASEIDRLLAEEAKSSR
jgi:hypothetical protein